MNRQETNCDFAARAGKFTGTRFVDLMRKTRSGGPAASRANLIAKLANEREIGTCSETYQSAAMLRGIEMEPVAREAYEDLRMELVKLVGFVQHPKLAFVGCSPDGLVGRWGMVQIKCRTADDLHLRSLLEGYQAEEYKWQLQGELWVCKRSWTDAISFDPRWRKDRRLAIKRVYRNEKMISQLEQECIAANQEVEEKLKELEALEPIT